MQKVSEHEKNIFKNDEKRGIATALLEKVMIFNNI
jgi:hypothetical protein